MIRIGILGGMSYESTIKYYDQILVKYFEKKHDYDYPEVIIFSLNFQRVIDLEHGENRGAYIDYLIKGIKALEQAGASFIVMAANSPHAVYEDLVQLAKVPILSIVKVTAEKAHQKHLKKLLLLGIKFTMQSTFYQDYFAKEGIEVITPSDEEQDKLNRIIFEELVIGVFKDDSKDEILRIINSYKTDGVILGCTELPLIISQIDTQITVLNTLNLHVEAVLNQYFELNTFE
ncbi:MAG: amino acid racemase [Candidatus Lokiarchaeota archaeon]|nr:amino acid racemase [Candidatus Lokiarchaeota archaeon]